MITQTTGRLPSNVNISHVESSVLQQLINYGLIGTMLYYGMYYHLYKAISIRHQWLRSENNMSARQNRNRGMLRV